MRVAIVGAGAVGVTYADAFARGGAEVAFRVRRAGPATFRIHALRPRADREVTAPLLLDDDALRAFRPDVVVTTVPSDALRDGDALRSLLGAVGDALVVSLEPGHDDLARFRAARPDVRLAQGVIALVAYQTPLAGDDRFPEPGVAVWAPLSLPFSGPGIGPVLEVLRRGGTRCHEADTAASAAFGAPTMAVWVTALRAAGWRFDGLADTAPLGYRAALEARAVAAAETGLRPPAWPALLRPLALRVGLRLAAAAVPFPLEPYLAFHFTKVGWQTWWKLHDLADAGAARGLPVGALRALLAAADDRSPLPEPAKGGA